MVHDGHQKRPRALWAAVPAGLALLALASCGPPSRTENTGGAGAVAARLVFPGASTRGDGIEPLASVDMRGEVDAIRVTVRRGGTVAASRTFAYTGPGGSGTIAGIPRGGNYAVVAEGLKGGTTVFRAVNSAVHVEGGQTTQVVARMIRVKSGQAVFTDYGTWLGGQEMMSHAVAAADLDGDGDIDLVFGDDGGSTIKPNTVLINRLNTTAYDFSDTGQTLGSAAWKAVALGDLDGDAFPDIAAASSPFGAVFLNSGAGSFTSTGQQLNTPLAIPSSLGMGDLDGDGDLDLAFGNLSAMTATGPAPVSFWLNMGAGAFTPGQELGSAHTAALALGDLDGDGDPDLVAAEVGMSQAGTLLSGSGRVYLNDGNGVFSPTGQALDQGVLTSVALGDLDGDGDLDLILGKADVEVRLAFMNDGSAVFSSVAALSEAVPVASAVLGDVDGDGDLDAAFAGPRGGRVWLNDGTGQFGYGGAALGEGGASALALADADADGEVDVVCAQEGSDRLWINRTARGNAVGKLVFAADDGTRGLELWAYDGAADAVTLAWDIHPASAPYSNHLQSLVPLNNKLYFPGDDGVHGCELWAYDGNTSWMAADLYPGRYATYDNTPRSFNPQFLYTDLRRIYLWSQDVPSPYLMWEYDESTAPALADSTVQAIGYYDHRFMARYAGKDFYAGWDAAHGQELWVDDGVSPPSMVADVWSGSSSAEVDDLLVFNGRLYFTATDSSHGRELWVYDETDGARLAYDLQPGSGNSDPEDFVEHGGRLYFSAFTNNYNLFEYEGYPDPPKFIMNGGGSKAAFGGGLYLAQWGLMKYNGTTFDTVLDPDPGAGYGEVGNLVAFDGRLFFTADDGTHGRELWSWDGSQGAMVEDIGPGDSIPVSYYHPALVPFVPLAPEPRLLAEASTGSVGGTSASLVLRDLNGDRFLDLVEGRDGLFSRTFLNDGSGGFTFGQNLGTYPTRALVAGDLDGDKDADVVQGSYGGYKRIWTNNGAGTFTSTGSFGGTGTNANTISLALADVDEDGDPDLAEGVAIYSNLDRIWRNNGAGVFGDTGQRFGRGFTKAFDFGDVDGDFDLDLLTGDSLYWYNRILANDGNGAFTEVDPGFGTTYVYSAIFGDVDQDGDLDVIQGDSEGGGILIWTNDGYGHFGTAPDQSLGADNTRALSLADMDRDGDPDIVAGNWNNPGRIYLNDGSGTFADSGIVMGSCAVSGLAVGDLDRDGNADVVTGCETGPNRIWYSGLWR